VIRYAYIIPLLPLLAFFVNLAVGRRLPRKGDWVSIAAIGAGLAMSIAIFAEVFRAYAAIQPALTKSAPDRTIPPLSGATGPGWTFTGAAGLSLENDLEPIAVRLCPPIARLQRQIRAAGAQAVGMSGSGATVFGLFESAEAAKRAFEETAFEAPTWARVAATQESR